MFVSTERMCCANAMDCSSPGSYVNGDSPGKNTGVGCHFLLQCFVTPLIAARQASLSITNSWSSLKLMPIESVMPTIRQMESWPPILHNLHLSPDIVPDSYQLLFRAQHNTYALWTQTPATSRGTFNGVRISGHIKTYCKT